MSKTTTKISLNETFLDDLEGGCFLKTKKAKPYYGLILEIRKQGFSHKDMAEMLGITAQSFSQKINRKSGKDFWLHEAIFISKKLKIDFKKFF